MIIPFFIPYASPEGLSPRGSNFNLDAVICRQVSQRIVYSKSTFALCMYTKNVK